MIPELSSCRHVGSPVHATPSNEYQQMLQLKAGKHCPETSNNSWRMYSNILTPMIALQSLLQYSTMRLWSIILHGYFLTFFQPGIESYIFILFATIATFCTQVIESSPLCFSSSWWLLPLLPHTRSTPSSTLMNNLGIICAMMLELQASPKSFLNSSARCS